MTINTKETEHITKDVLKCNHCGCEVLDDPDIKYEYKSRCPGCVAGQMMAWTWNGWKNHEAREMHKRIWELECGMNELLQVSQTAHNLSRFSDEEKTIGPGVRLAKLGQELPWMGAFGSASIKVWGIRRRGSIVEYGVGNEEPPILTWVKADAFPTEWSQ